MVHDQIDVKSPYNFGTAILKPFKSGPGSLGFVLKSAIFYAVVITILLAIFGRMIIGPYIDIIMLSIEQGPSAVPDEELMKDMMAAIGRMTSGYIGLVVGGWAIWVMIESALHRRVLRQEYKSGLFPWRFGADEWRTMLSQLILYGAYMGLYMAVYLVAIILVLIAALAGSASVAIGVIIGIIAAIVIFAGIGIMIYVLIRLAPMAAMNVAQNELVIDKAWRVSKGRSWPSFGAYAFHYIVSSIVFYIVMVILFFAFLGGMMPMFEQLGNVEEADQVMAVLSNAFAEPGMKIGLAIVGFIMSFMAAIWMMCIAGISSHVTELYLIDHEEEGAKVFD